MPVKNDDPSPFQKVQGMVYDEEKSDQRIDLYMRDVPGWNSKAERTQRWEEFWNEYEQRNNITK